MDVDKFEFVEVAMIIVSNNKSISFNINGYEYPNHKSSICRDWEN